MSLKDQLILVYMLFNITVRGRIKAKRGRLY